MAKMPLTGSRRKNGGSEYMNWQFQIVQATKMEAGLFLNFLIFDDKPKKQPI
jgi:hypothetical protein